MEVMINAASTAADNPAIEMFRSVNDWGNLN
jgi:hypothetical protein